ncbi:SMI1/KNR4 family protein [Shewanella sp. C32]|uniref:SMI1/KNR4 family protein n=1 Tax=Shewanella electrica TaxID=515560 RepID=A0ABT2FFV4_9GAMM|nr:SMI1/KNR4 family protein [Shewanella electrica]MCH1925347.1 SMI1/KNR4 family protein [Shewanella electrica]MCS4555172.1 SMI1/KNR4 family protein [Shewanella electrica]
MQQLTLIERYFEHLLPASYRTFLASNSSSPNDDILLYNASNVIERNHCYETKTYAPGFINIGDDGGGMAFILSLTAADPMVYRVDHGSMDPQYAELVAHSFSQWLADGCPVVEE